MLVLRKFINSKANEFRVSNSPILMDSFLRSNPDAQNIGVKGVAISCSIQNNTRTGFLLIYEPQTKQPIVNIRISDSISVTGELFLGMHDSDGKYWTLMMRNNVEMNEIVRQILIIEFWAQENERSIVGMKLGGQSDELAGKNASFRKKRIIQGTGTLFSLDFDSNELVNLSVKNLQPLTNEDISIVFTFPTPSLNDLFSAQSLRIRRNIAEMTDSEHKIFLMERTDCLLADNEIHIPEKTSVLFDFQIHSLNSNEEKLDTSVFVAEEANLENETEEKLKLIQKIAKIGGEHVLPNLSQAPHISSLENSTSEMKLSENGQHIDVDSQLEKNFKIDDESIIQINKKLDQILDNISFISIQSPRNNMKKLGSRESNDVIPDVSPSTIVLVFENLIKEKEDLRHSLNHSSEIIASLKRSISDSRAQHLEEMQTQSSVHESQYISLKETSQKQYKQILELQRVCIMFLFNKRLLYDLNIFSGQFKPA